MGDGKRTHRPPRPLIMSEKILDWLSSSILNYQKRQLSNLRNQAINQETGDLVETYI